LPPMWSSWAWVRPRPTTCLRRSRTYVKSGRTRSTPSISSVGNIRPVSTIRILPSCSKRVMFRPISPTPPSQTTRVRPVAALPSPVEPRPVRRRVALPPPPPLPPLAPLPPAGEPAAPAVSAAISSHQPCRPQRPADRRHLIGRGFGQRETGGSGRMPGQFHGGFHRDRVGGDGHCVVDAGQLGVEPAGLVGLAPPVGVEHLGHPEPRTV